LESSAVHNGLEEQSTLQRCLGVLRRRKWLALLPVVLTAGFAVLYSLSQPHRYEATATTLLTRQNLASTLNGSVSPDVYQDPVRLAQTQVDIARVPALAARVLRVNRLHDRTVDEFLASSRVSPEQNADVLDFRVTDPSRNLAVQLATSYAREYTVYRRALDSIGIARAEQDVRRQLRRLHENGRTGSPLYTSLKEKEQQLRIIAALGNSNAVLLRPADGAKLVQPRPVRNGVLGGILGVLLGLALVGVREAIDTRARSTEEIGEALGLPLLGRLPPPRRRLQRRQQLVMLVEPESVEAEAFRMLRMSVELASVDKGPRAIMVTSAFGLEGKTTTAANLAVAFARMGRRVTLVDLDLRRPGLEDVFAFEEKLGLTSVALGDAELLNALAYVEIPPDEANRLSRKNGRPPTPLTLEVLPSGPLPPSPGEFSGTNSVAEILAQLRERSELVLVDAPPLLPVGDAIALSSRVDGMIVVVRASTIRRPMLRELRRVLEGCPAAKLGFVLTDVPMERSSQYHGYYGKPAGARKAEKVR
jgi:capsular exopolysaccharide synthesis family protein